MDNAVEALQLIKLSYEFARDLSQHLITLATGTIAVSITFTRDILRGVAVRSTATWLLLSWMLFLLSIAFGVWAQMAITGSLDHYQAILRQVDEICGDPVAIGRNVTIPAALQVMCFLTAAICIVGFGFRSLPLITHQESATVLDSDTAKD